MYFPRALLIMSNGDEDDDPDIPDRTPHSITGKGTSPTSADGARASGNRSHAIRKCYETFD
jgi:hypothetical protein